mmetsp:Transcript_50741/g.82011  ORF Transcript_50741/g.82011 Transcript_50741/m.82011 type:complete len:223 (-) Transcript_50741:454-1122(-)
MGYSVNHPASDTDLDDLLEEIKEMKLDLPVSRGTDKYDRPLGKMGGEEKRGNVVAMNRRTSDERSVQLSGQERARGKPQTMTGFDGNSRPTTAQVLEELEREGLESSPERHFFQHSLKSTSTGARSPQPAGPDLSSSMDRLEDAVLQDFSSWTPDASPVRGKSSTGTSIDDLLQEIAGNGSGDDEFAQEAQQGTGGVSGGRGEEYSAQTPAEAPKGKSCVIM